MARPRKQGLDYFPHDTDAISDDKVEILRALHGNNGYVFYFGMLDRIYREPEFEYSVSDAEIVQILCKKLYINSDEFHLILTSALKYGCFDKELYEKTGKLSSSGIKKRAAVVKCTPIVRQCDNTIIIQDNKICIGCCMKAHIRMRLQDSKPVGKSY